MKPEEMKNPIAKLMFIIGILLLTITSIATLFMIIGGSEDYSNVQLGAITTVLLIGFGEVIELLTEIKNKINK